ncbi:MAG: hypothetical protein K2X66_06480 [Cyanobacteria bacterium]|nr:hypothetical protein [Cyanobacteriota bacterium]
MNCKTISLQELPPYPQGVGKTEMQKNMDLTQSISIYLSRLWVYQIGGGGKEGRGYDPKIALKLPSLVDLSKFFQCSQMDVYDTLQVLRRKGYDYDFRGMETPILLWQLERFSESFPEVQRHSV